MWFAEKIAEITTPRVVRAFISSRSEELVKDTLSQDAEKSVRRLNPAMRAIEWSGLGVVDITASYLRRSIMRPSHKRDLLIRTLENRSHILFVLGDFAGSLQAITLRGKLL